MDLRAYVYSPTQNQALWLAAWLYHQESFDELSDALQDLGGQQVLAGGGGLAELCALVRSHGRIDDPLPHPRVEVLLPGPGDPMPKGIAIVGEEHAPLLLRPQFTGEATQWAAEVLDGPLVGRAFLSPGDADALLTEATNNAATLIERSGHQPSSERRPDPRLTVGTLTDFYANPGLPDALPARAGKLIARADTVAAIVETVLERHGNHMFDPELLALSRPIRLARMAAVSYACVEWGRLRG